MEERKQGLNEDGVAMAGKPAEMYESKDGGEHGGQELKPVDECLADAGYNVRPSELRQVAHKLEQLEMVLGAAQEAGISHLSSEAVHYNPSDLAGWIESMLHELSVPNSNELLIHHTEFLSARAGHLSGIESGASALDSASVGPRVDGSRSGTGSGSGPGSAGVDAAILDEFPEPGFLEEYSLQNNYRYGGDGGDGLFGHMDGLFCGTADPSVFPWREGEPHSRSQSHESHQIRAGDGQNALQEIRKAGNSSSLLPVNKILHCRDPFQNRPASSSSSAISTEERIKDRKRLRGELFSSTVQGIDQQTFFSNNNSRQRGEEDEAAAAAQVLSSSHLDGIQDSGVRLVHTLMGCAEAVHQQNLAMADEMVKQIRMLASSLGGAMGKVATYFAEALARRIYGFSPQDNMYLKNDSLSELLHIHFYETCPYLKFAHFTANQAILEAFEGHKRVHVIDFNLKQGVQWPALIQALALRPGGPPALRLTGIGPPHPDGNDVLHEVGLKLAQLAESINVEFDFRGYMTSKLSDVKPWMLDVKPGEAVAVNSVFQLHRLLYSAHRTSDPAPVDEVLASIRSLNPKIVTMVEQEANHNNPSFMERFTEALHYFSTMFDSLEACRLPHHSTEQLMSEMYLGRQICNIVACEGLERVERHETLIQWRVRMCHAGFRPLHLGSNAFKQASMLLTLFSGEDGYRVEENNGCLTLGWHSRPLISVSAWQCC
eukprot:Gb_32252 [translate_table: standard]